MSLALTDHATDGPQPLSENEVLKWWQGAAMRRAKGLVPWWLCPDADEWADVARWFPELSREEVLADPFIVDQAVREWQECKRCRMGEAKPGGGVYPCNLWRDAWVGEPMHPGGSNMWYLVHVELPYAEGERPRWEWRKRRCGGPERRASEIATLEKRWQTFGGMKAVEVDDNDIPF